MGKNMEDIKIVTCHLGNGASICAVKNGLSVDTSMGFTPLDVVFTAGLGENSGVTRKAICDYLGYLGVAIDDEKNGMRGEAMEISSADSKVNTFVIPTNEELMIARDTKALALNK